MSSVRSVSETVSHELWKRESLQVSHDLSNGPQINAKLVLVVPSAASPLVARLSVENAEHGEAGQVIVYPRLNQQVDLRVIGDRPVGRVYLANPSRRLFFERELKRGYEREMPVLCQFAHPVFDLALFDLVASVVNV